MLLLEKKQKIVFFYKKFQILLNEMLIADFDQVIPGLFYLLKELHLEFFHFQLIHESLNDHQRRLNRCYLMIFQLLQQIFQQHL